MLRYVQLPYGEKRMHIVWMKGGIFLPIQTSILVDQEVHDDYETRIASNTNNSVKKWILS